jgi:phospholipid transport system substrate-binding protein
MTATMPFRLGFVVALCAAVVAFAAPAAKAEAKSSDALASFIQQMGDNALTSLTGKDIAIGEREKRVRALLEKNFDIATIGRFALGTYWREATPTQKKEYLSLFEDMIVKTYAQRFSEYSGQTFTVGTSRKVTDRDSIVASQVLQKDGPPVNVEWRVRRENGTTKVIDVIIENISMSTTQRSDFAAVIQRGGGKVEALLESLRARKAQKN